MFNFFSRSASQYVADIKAYLNSQLQNNFDVENSPVLSHFAKLLGGIAEQINYYVDSYYNEAFVSLCKLILSAYNHAKNNDVIVNTKKPSSGDLTFKLTPLTEDVELPATTIPQGFLVSDGNGVIYKTVETLIIPYEVDVNEIKIFKVGIVNELITEEANLFTSNGTPSQKVYLANINDVSLNKLYITDLNGITWTQVDTFAYSDNQAKNFLVSVDEDGIYVLFGDGVNGLVPPNGLSFVYRYESTSGANSLAMSITQFISAQPNIPNFEIEIYNDTATSGGGDIDNIYDITKNVIYKNRSNGVIYNSNDSKTVPLTHPSVAQVHPVNRHGLFIDYYIYPIGGGIASTVLCNDVLAFINQKSTLGYINSVIPCGEANVYIVADVFCNQGILLNVVKDNIVTAFEDNGYKDKLKIGGAIRISDLYAIIEGVQNVNYSDIKLFYVKMTAKKSVSTQPTLLVDYTYNYNIQTINYRIKIKFVSSTAYRIYINENLMDNFDKNVGTSYSIVFGSDTILTNFVITANSYSASMEYQFSVLMSRDSNSVIFNDIVVPIVNEDTLTLNMQYV